MYLDAKAERIRARAEQERAAQDAAVERAAREAEVRLRIERQRLQFERERRAQAEADRRERERIHEERREKRAQKRRERWQERRAALAGVAGQVAGFLRDHGALVLVRTVTVAVMFTAWNGQYQFARGVLQWHPSYAWLFPLGVELAAIGVATLADRARSLNAPSVPLRLVTWALAGSAAAMNYAHHTQRWTEPTDKAVTYAAMSVTSIVLWEVVSYFAHLRELAEREQLPPRVPRIGRLRWLRYPREAFAAWSLAIRDQIPDSATAWARGVAWAAAHPVWWRRAARAVVKRRAVKPSPAGLALPTDTRIVRVQVAAGTPVVYTQPRPLPPLGTGPGRPELPPAPEAVAEAPDETASTAGQDTREALPPGERETTAGPLPSALPIPAASVPAPASRHGTGSARRRDRERQYDSDRRTGADLVAAAWEADQQAIQATGKPLSYRQATRVLGVRYDRAKQALDEARRLGPAAALPATGQRAA